MKPFAFIRGSLLLLIGNNIASTIVSAEPIPSAENVHLEEASRTIFASINYSADPCTDFYEFACGNWAQAHPMPAHKDYYDYYEVFDSKIALNLHSMIEESIEEYGTEESTFYRKCLDQDRINSRGHYPMANLLEQLLGHKWPLSNEESHPGANSLHIWQSIYLRMFSLDVNPLMMITFYRNPNNEHRNQILIKPPYFIFPDYQQVREIVKIFAASSSHGMLLNETLLDRVALDITLFELQLASIQTHPSLAVGGDISLFALDIGTQHRLDWTAFLNSILRRSMHEFISLVQNFKSMDHSFSELELIRNTLEIFKLAADLAQNVTFPASKSEMARKLVKLLDHSQLELIKRWLNSEDVISELLHSLYSSPMFTRSDSIYVSDVEYFERLTQLLASTPPHVLVNYMGWKAVSYYRNYIGGQVWHAFNEPKPDILPGPWWEHCIKRVIKVYPWNVSHRYVKQFVAPDTKSKVSQLFTNPKDIFEQILHQSSWLDYHTRIRALDKLNTMRAFISHPDWLLDNYNFTYLHQQQQQPGEIKEFFESALDQLRFNRVWQILVLKFTSRNDFHGWSEAPISVSAYHLLETNSIAIPFSILQPPLFHPNYSPMLIYGGLLPVIAHELLHGFDTYGAHYDRRGHFTHWWAPETWTHFKDKAECLIEQYQDIDLPTTWFKINGQRTIGEDISDNGAIRVAFKAFRELSSRALLSSRLPYTSLTPAQVFFLQYAQTFCGHSTIMRFERQLLYDTHSPDKYRVNVPLSNFEPFSTAFQCPTWSEMNRQVKCSIWQ